MTELIAHKVVFYCDSDEAMFFKFLNDNPAVIDVRGEGGSILVGVDDGLLNHESFLALYSVFKRYDVDTKQLARMKLNHDNHLQDTIRNPNMLWFGDIYG